MNIQKVGLRSLARVVGSFYLLIGLIAGAALTIAAVRGLVPSDLEGIDNAVPLAIVWMPILLGIKGYLLGALAALVFNLFAAVTGGIEIEVELGGGIGALEAARSGPATAS